MSVRTLLTQPTNVATKRIFIAGTRMNDGKTTTCLGLFAALQQRFGNVGFIKPIGQRFVEIDGRLIDEDSVLLGKIYNVKVPIESMSPVAIDGTFTRRYLEDPAVLDGQLTDTICRAFDRASWEKEFTLIEGSGHAGVGSVFNKSNARVAKILGAKAIIISRGGIGQPIDEIAMNKALFDQEGVEVIGAIINKVQPDKMDLVRKYCGLALDRLGIPLLGLLPEEKTLQSPNLHQIAERIGGSWLHEEKAFEWRRIRNFIIGAMTAPNLLKELAPGTLLITPGDREDILRTVVEHAANVDPDIVAAVVLTRGVLPEAAILKDFERCRIPVLLADEDSFHVASRIHGMTVKTQPEDSDKIPLIKRLIQENLNLEDIAAAL